MDESLIPHEEWNAVSSKYEFVQGLYNYYYHRGGHTIIGRELEHCVRICALWTLNAVCVSSVDWACVMRCTNEECASCWTFSLGWIAAIYLGVLALFILFTLRQAIVHLVHVGEIRRVYRFMGILDDELALFTWSEVCTRFCKLNVQKRYVLHDCSPTSLSATVVLHDDHLSSLLHSECIPEWLLTAYVDRLWRTFTTRIIGATVGDARLLLVVRRFAAALLVCTPIVLIHLIGHMLIMHTHDIRRGAPTLLSYDFTPVARIRHRQVGELPHALFERLEKARPHAEIYVQYFMHAFWKSLLHAVHFLSGLCLMFVLTLTTLNDDVVLHMTFAGVPTVTAIALLSMSLFVRPPSSTHRHCDEQMRRAFNLLVAHIQAPVSWSVVSIASAREVQSIFRPQWKLVLCEVRSCLGLPFFLLNAPDETLLTLLRIPSPSQRPVHPVEPVSSSADVDDDRITDSMVSAYMSMHRQGVTMSAELDRSSGANDA